MESWIFYIIYICSFYEFLFLSFLIVFIFILTTRWKFRIVKQTAEASHMAQERRILFSVPCCFPCFPGFVLQLINVPKISCLIQGNKKIVSFYVYSYPVHFPKLDKSSSECRVQYGSFFFISVYLCLIFDFLFDFHVSLMRSSHFFRIEQNKC